MSSTHHRDAVLVLVIGSGDKQDLFTVWRSSSTFLCGKYSFWYFYAMPYLIRVLFYRKISCMLIPGLITQVMVAYVSIRFTKVVCDEITRKFVVWSNRLNIYCGSWRDTEAYFSCASVRMRYNGTMVPLFTPYFHCKITYCIWCMSFTDPVILTYLGKRGLGSLFDQKYPLFFQ